MATNARRSTQVMASSLSISQTRRAAEHHPRNKSRGGHAYQREPKAKATPKGLPSQLAFKVREHETGWRVIRGQDWSTTRARAPAVTGAYSGNRGDSPSMVWLRRLIDETRLHKLPS